jgi:multiple sugar transport system permease protein
VRIYLPLMTPALAAVGTYALLLSWSEYLYQYLLLSTKRNWTVAVALEQFWDSDEAPWNYMMALSIIYALPPIAIFYGLSRYVASRLTGIKR